MVSIYNHRTGRIGATNKPAPKRTWSVNPPDYRLEFERRWDERRENENHHENNRRKNAMFLDL